MESVSTYFRRCHICSTVTEQDKRVEQCQRCKKFLAPFYYFDDRKSFISSENQQKIKEGEIRPLMGLTVYWS